MATQYSSVGARTQVGQPDNTGNNTGNWTVTFTPADMNVQVSSFEVYKIVISGAPGSTFNVFVDINQWDTSVRGDINSWDPNQPLLVSPGQSLYFYWSDPITDGTPPEVTIWLRFSLNNPNNLSLSI